MHVEDTPGITSVRAQAGAELELGNMASRSSSCNPEAKKKKKKRKQKKICGHHFSVRLSRLEKPYRCRGVFLFYFIFIFIIILLDFYFYFFIFMQLCTPTFLNIHMYASTTFSVNNYAHKRVVIA